MAIRTCFLTFTGFFFSLMGWSQEVTYKRTPYKIGNQATVNARAIERDFRPVLEHREMPHPGTDKARLAAIKAESRKRFPVKTHVLPIHHKNTRTVPGPILKRGYNGNDFDGSSPNDNAMAISRDGMVISSVNSSIVVFHVDEDTFRMNVSLEAFGDTLIPMTNKYDPKAIYDPDLDRFVLVFLSGNESTETDIIFCFSKTNDPAGEWFLYSIGGNPFMQTTWSDYPAIALTKDDLFLTINLVRDNEPWQTGFSQTLIWQIEKMTGFNGDTALNAVMWSDINVDSTRVRNLHPVRGGSQLYGPNQYFLSNRNFAVQNDSIFLVEVSGNTNDVEATLTVSTLITDVAYGVPPNAFQANNRLFQTNDARVLGGFWENDQIQFVSNTIDTTTGLCAVYHGIIDDPDGERSIRGYIIGDSIMDYGYPNLSYSGQQACDHESIITFDHTAVTVFAGMSAIYYGNDQQYSDPIMLKQGENYSNVGFNSIKRWGDYSASQRKYDEPGTVWAAGFWANVNRENQTWIAEIKSPDSTIMVVNIQDTIDASVFGAADGQASVTVSGGNEPYAYSWNDSLSQTTAAAIGLTAGDYEVVVTDAFDCAIITALSIQQPDPEPEIVVPEATLFPNPAYSRATMNFHLQEDMEVTIAVYDMKGKLVATLFQDIAKQGDNLFSFSTEPLSRGMYVLRIVSGKETVYSEKFVR